MISLVCDVSVVRMLTFYGTSLTVRTIANMSVIFTSLHEET
eukprot:UN08753